MRRIEAMGRALAAAMMAAALASGLPGAALAVAPDDVEYVEGHMEGPVEAARVDLVPLEMVVTPKSIECGVPCGMEEMCGLDPCLCGPVDGFGACACNGLETVYPHFAIEDDGGGRVTVVELFGRPYLVPLAEGPTNALVRVSLPHYVDAVVPVRVEVAGWTVFDVLKVLAMLAVAAVLLGLVALAVWAVAPKVKKLLDKIPRRDMEEDDLWF